MAEATTKLTPNNDRINRESAQLVPLLKEMKEGLDSLVYKIQTFTAKVKAGNYPTADGISYLEAKHLLLLNYCQSLVYFVLRKSKGLPIQDHPVVRSLVETRLFLEKIRPIDKKLEYQIQKLTKTKSATTEEPGSVQKEAATTKKTEDLLKLRPNPDLLISKTNVIEEDGSGVYKPPKFAPSAMKEDKSSKNERNAMRKDKQFVRQAKQSSYVRELLNDLEGRPEEISENIGSESREMSNYISKMEERARQEEELFTRAPITKVEKKKLKYLTKSRNGMNDLTEGFYDEIKTLSMDGDVAEQPISFNNAPSGDKKFKKRKRKY